jgi:hypothetical protein
MIRRIVQIKQLANTQGVRCVKLNCGHERIFSSSDFKKCVSDGPEMPCAECQRQGAN